MEIIITKGKGSGRNQLSAFDSALFDAGIANFNLLPLTSVIPPGSKIVVKKIDWNERDFGNKLYVVMARANQNVIGKEAWAGIGWVQDEEGKGLFVEHTGDNEEDVIQLINNSLCDMIKYRPQKYSKLHYVTCGVTCKNHPVCAVVVAVYKSEGWDER